MNDILKQRLVGALILLALGVVFWPIIFVEPEERQAREQQRIPAPPAIDTSPIEAPSAEGLRASPEWAVEDMGAAQDIDIYATAPAEVTDTDEPAVEPGAVEAEGISTVETRGTRDEAPEQPTLDEQGLPVAWILQVASVSSAGKADELRNRLLAMDEKAYVKKLERGQKNLYRVYIGPNIERAQLERIQADIDQRFGVRSLIVRYAP